MPRYEYKEGSSSKFWEIELSGSSFTTKHGRIGTPGASLVKDWPDAATAQKEYDKLVAQKTKKGYQLVGGTPAKAAKASKAAAVAPKLAKAAPGNAAPKAAKGTPKAAAPAGGGAYNAALAKVIDADPDDAGAWAVYADWLQGQGDPRGELGIVQERLRAAPKDKALLAAEKKLLKDHAQTLIGDYVKYMTRDGKPDVPGVTAKPDLAPEYRSYDSAVLPIRAMWRSGFFAELRLGHPDYDWTPATAKKRGGDDDDGDGGDGEGGDIDMPKLILDVLASPAARFVTSLRLGMPHSGEDGECTYATLWKKLAGHEALGRLRSLYIGDIAQSEMECSWINIGDISKLYKSLAKLRSLTLHGSEDLKLGAIDLPELRELTIITGGLDKKNVAAICAAKWPKLEKLELWLGQKSYGATTTLKDLAPILGGKPFPKLAHLGLRNCEFADELGPALVTAKVVKQLESLDLSKGTMTDAGVQPMIDNTAVFAHLRRMDLSDNYLGKLAAKAASICKAVRTRPQRTADEWDGVQHRYPALGE